MKLKKSFALLVLISFFANCSKNEIPVQNQNPDTEQKPEPEDSLEPNETVNEIYFSYHDDPNDFFSYWTENWMIIHNQDGELLDYKAFQRGDSLVFEGNEEKLANTNSLSVTTLRYYPIIEFGGNVHSISTTSDVKKGDVWTWGLPESMFSNPSVPNPEGTDSFQYNITVDNVPNISWNALVNETGLSTRLDAKYYESNTLEINGQHLFPNINYLLILRDGSNQIKYSYLDLPNYASDLILDYNKDFLAFDTILEIDLPEHIRYTSSIYANDSSKPYNNPIQLGNDDSFGQTRTKALLGYLNDFDWFRTYLLVQYSENINYEYLFAGAIPEEIIVPENPELFINNSDLYAFDFSTNLEYSQHYIKWNFHDPPNFNSTTYGFNGYPDSNYVLGTLPEEILDRYPELNLENLDYQEMKFKFGRNPNINVDNKISVLGSFKDAYKEKISFSKNED